MFVWINPIKFHQLKYTNKHLVKKTKQLKRLQKQPNLTYKKMIVKILKKRMINLELNQKNFNKTK